MKGRSITENITLTREMIQNTTKKYPNYNVAFNLELTKAYNRDLREFLCEVSEQFGFSNTWISII